MKKFLLSFCCLAAAMTASADKATFVPQNGGYTYDGEGQVVTIPVSWNGQTLYFDAFNMYVGGGTRNVSNGAIFVQNTTSAQSYINFTPSPGVTITKIEFRMFNPPSMKTQFDGTTLAADGFTQVWTGEITGNEEMNKTQRFNLHKDGETPVTTERVRLHAITVEYTGTPQRCLMPVINTQEYITNKSLQLTCPEPGATIWYSLQSSCVYQVNVGDTSEDTGFTKYDGQPINLTQVTKLSAYATVDGKRKSALYYHWYVPGPEDSHQASFNFARPETLNPNPGASGSSMAGIPFKDNGITFTNTSTASKASNGPRFMCTETYGLKGELRHADDNGKNNNKMTFVTDNPENYICQVTILGSGVNGKFAAASTDGDKNEFTFPGINYDDETSVTSVFQKTTEMGGVGQYICSWRIPDDYEGEEVVNKLVFDVRNATNIDEIHVFYWGENGDNTGINDITSDDSRIDENAPIEYFNLQGIRIANPQNGIFIRRQGHKADKVYIK